LLSDYLLHKHKVAEIAAAEQERGVCSG
jgi:hypothetical protein